MEPNQLHIDANENVPVTTVKKRGRKPKVTSGVFIFPPTPPTNITNATTNTATVISDLEDTEENETACHSSAVDLTKPTTKKRGRKPKGGKIISLPENKPETLETKPNIILHLKCHLSDLLKNQETTIEGYNTTASTFGTLVSWANEVNQSVGDCETYDDEDMDDEEFSTRTIWKKLKALEHILHTNNVCDKKSDCFWCTCAFDNPPIYIPKHKINDTYHVYGCFCSPECAVAHLMRESIDTSTKFERYGLLNYLYGKIYNYEKNIKPAPNPHYLLDKYYGNLSIQEYRALLQSERLFLVVDKPLTRVMPELHEDNDDFIINNKIIPSNTHQVKKRLQKQTKTNIINERFGLTNGIE